MFSNLYLEHYLESLESLPQELKRNFTSMHELDVKSKSILENLDAASDEYLRKVRELSPDRRKIEMEKIQAMFKKSKEHGDEKVKIAIKTYELVDKHIRRLDSDLAKFESEIKEKGRLSQSEGEDEEDGEENLKERPSQQQQHSHTSSTSSHHKKSAKKNSSNNNSSGGHAGNHSSSRQKKGDSKKSSKQDSSGSSSKRNLKDSASSSSTKEEVSKKKKSSKTPTHSSSSKKEESLLPDLSKGPQEVLDMPVDPNEPTYCTCHQVSYGEMIGCDNVECPIEWFHFGCMGLNTKPKGRWYCPLCSHMFKKKK